MKKICCGCKKEKDLEKDFNTSGWNKTRTAKRYKHICKTCSLLYNKALRARKRESRIANGWVPPPRNTNKGRIVNALNPRRKEAPIKSVKLEIKQWLFDYKRSCRCADCKMPFQDQPYLIDFHHKDPTVKSFEISSIYKLRGDNLKQRVIEELAKCLVLCANCHRTRHERPRYLKYINKNPPSQVYELIACPAYSNSPS